MKSNKEYSKQYYFKNRQRISKYYKEKYKEKRIKQNNKPCLKIIYKNIYLTFS